MSRPKKPPKDNKTERITSRMTGSERATIERRARAAGLSPSAYLVANGIGGADDQNSSRPANDHPAASPATPYPFELIFEARKIGVNVNQAMRAINELRKFRPDDPQILPLATSIARGLDLLNSFLAAAYQYDESKNSPQRRKF